MKNGDKDINKAPRFVAKRLGLQIFRAIRRERTETPPQTQIPIPQQWQLQTYEPRLLLSADLAIDLTQTINTPPPSIPSGHVAIDSVTSSQGAPAAAPAIRIDLTASSEEALSAATPLFSSVALSDAADAQSPAQQNVSGFFGQLPGQSKSSQLTITADDGTQATFTLKGRGLGSVSYSDNQFQVTLSGTDAKSKFIMRVDSKNGTTATLGALHSGTDLSSIEVKGVALQGQIDINGKLAKLVLGDVTGPSSITVNGAGKKLDIQAGNIQDLVLQSDTPIGSLLANRWLDTDAMADAVIAPSIDKLLLRGDFAADLVLNAADALHSANIIGEVSGHWNIQGEAGKLILGNTDSAFTAAFNDAVSTLQVTGNASGSFSMPSLRLLNVGGNLEQAKFAIGVNLGADGAWGGVDANADQFGSGELTKLVVRGSVKNSQIWVGVKPVDGIYDNGNDQLLDPAHSFIKSMSVGGPLLGRTRIIAGAFPLKVKLNGKSIKSDAVPELLTQPADEVEPVLTAALASDTGSDSGDRLTHDATVSGLANDLGGIASLKGALDSADFTDITAVVGSNGSFELTPAQLAELAADKTLFDGNHTLHLLATDLAGNSTSLALAFELDTSAPSGSAGLDAASDTGMPGDLITAQDTVKLVGQAPAGTRVRLGDMETTADAAGAFAFDNIPLAQGDNAFGFALTDAAGNTATVNLTVRRAPIDTVAPVVSSLALSFDTGSSDTDGLTSSATLQGTGNDNVGVTRLLVALDDPNFDPNYNDLSGLLAADGSFTLAQAQLAALAGGTLVDGVHSVRVAVEDAAGNRSAEKTVTFMLDTLTPNGSAALDAVSDTGTPGDLITTQATVRLIGQAPGGTRVRLGDMETTADAANTFAFDNVPLALGDNEFSFALTDAAGNTATVNLTVRRDPENTGDTEAPMLSSLALSSDTGSSDTDGITSSAMLQGAGSDNVGVARLLVALGDPNFDPIYSDLSGLLAADGSFSLAQSQLAVLAGGTLADGEHSVRVAIEDAAGNRSAEKIVTFTLDTQAPTGSQFGVSSADAVNGDDGKATSAIVVLRGTAEVGSTVSLGDIRAVVGGSGTFTLPGVALALGDNTINLNVTDAAGNTSSLSRTITRIEQAQTDAVLIWNDIALRAIQLEVTDPPVATRTLAMLSLAQYDTLAAIEGSPAYLVQRSVAGAVDVQSALATAAHRILSLTYPAQQGIFDAALASGLSGIADGAAKDNGIALGLSIADSIWALRANDGSGAFVDYSGSTAVGQWRPTGPMFDVPDEPQWGSVTPFALTSPSEFRPAAPPALDTAAYAVAVNEIKLLGSATSATRTADQTQQALFWADGKGSYTPPGHWNQIAAQVATAEGNSLSANVRLFAQLNVALADAAIAGWDAKYTYGLWRPETAIQNAEFDGNSETSDDDAWRPLLITPAHPEYVSGHSTFSAAAATILADAFGNDTAFSTTSATLPGVTRDFTSFSQAAEEAGRSRIYGGIHYEFTNQAGNVLGEQVANAVLSRFALTEDLQAPVVTAQNTPEAVKTNLTLNGQILDNLSGVASVQYRIDVGDLQDLTLDANGNFAITTAFALDGSADGSHSITLIARDAAGNLSAGYVRSFTLDTRVPIVTLTSIAEGDTLAGGVRLTGTADATGTTLTQLNYRLDDGTLRSLVFDGSSGSFDAALDFGTLLVGDHTLTLTAQDAAGNATTLIRTVKVDALAPFTITAASPAAGSSDVGVTFRPQVTFSRPVNTDTLTSDSFYATAPDGSKLDATIVPALDGSFAWLFFIQPMPGAAQITLHVDGSKIRAAADGSFLDADADGASGGQFSLDFTTVSRTSVPGTKIVGIVADPGPDLEPMTFDDIGRGADGIIHTPDDVFKRPIAHAKVYILGQEDKFVFTDGNGYFELTDVPAGTVKVVIDGRTATNAPDGVFFPEMVMDAELIPGVANTLMGSMGTSAERLANADRQEVYLPRIATSVLQAVSATEPTVINAVDPAAAPDLTEAQRAALTLTVNPGSAVDQNGNPVTNAQIGIATVPPELVRDMLPPGVLQHTFDITIQAPGVAAFAEPVQITLPNVFNAAPGTKLNILSFDHTTGRLVINGTGTVSADGLTVVSDPGSGVRAPGWHGLTPPGTPTTGPDNPPPQDPPPCINSQNAFDIVIDLTTAAANCAAELAGIGSALKAVLTVSDKARSIAESVVTLQAELNKPGVSTAQLAATFKIINDGKSAVVAVVEAFEKQNPISRALKIAKCLEAILSGLDNVCGRIQQQGGECNTTLVKTICVGIGAVKTQLGEVNKLIEKAEAGLKQLGLAFICAKIDQIATALSLAANAESAPAAPATGARTLQLAEASSTYPDSLFEDIQQLIDALAANMPNFDALQDFGSGYYALNNSTSDLDQTAAKMYSSFVSGLPGNTYYLIRIDGNELRGRTDSEGKIDVFLAPDADYSLSLYDPVAHKVANVYGHTSPTGQASKLPAVAFASLDLSSLPVDEFGVRIVPEYLLPDGQGGLLDRDADGLPDVVEEIVGTKKSSADSDQDGLLDLAELQQGLNPLDGIAVATGVISSTAIKGSAEAVAVIGSTDGKSDLTVLLATGNNGLAVVDASQVTKSKVLAELDLTGNNTDVAVDAVRGIAVLAANDAGLHIVDISDPSSPTLRQTLAFASPVSHVEVRDGIAYVTTGSDLASVDLNTGEVRTTLSLSSLGGGTLTDLAIDGDTLFTMDGSRVLRSISIAGDVLTLLDNLTLSTGGGRLFVGGGVAYIGGTGGFQQGFSTVNVANPADLLLLSNPDATNITNGAIVANGSGLAVSIGNLPGIGNRVQVIDVSDPTDTSAFITQYDLSDAPRDITLANGLAFVADGSGGLQIVNYVGFDTKGIAPNVAISVEGADADPATPGTQVLEGRTVRVIPTISDDVQVRSVELLVNGQVVFNDIAFPFELFAQVPTIAAGGSTLNIQVRATDTGGNVALSNLVTLDVVPDTFAPVVSSVSVEEGARRFFVRSIDLVFDEPIDTTRLNTSGVSLLRAGNDGLFGTADDVSVPVTLDSRAFGQRVSVLIDGLLPPGEYQFTLDPSIINDRAGNALADPVVRHFTIRPASDVKAAMGVPEIATAPSANPGQQIGIAVPFDPATARAEFSVIDAAGNRSTTVVSALRTDTARGIAYFTVPLNAVTGDAVVYSLVGNTRTDFADGTFPLQIIPTLTGVEVQSVASDGSSAVVVLRGTGFIEGNNSEYRFGSGADGVVVLDAGVSAGADVQQIYDAALGQNLNGQVTLTVPLSDGAFGPISVKTAGGVSASFSVSLSSVTATALSGTPANAAIASANPGQAVTLNGAGLSTASDVLLRYTDYSGALQTLKVSPIAAAADGSSATLTVPLEANGIVSLQVFGSSSQPQLQIVPVLASSNFDGNLHLYGAGFVEGGSQYTVGGSSVTDSVINDGVDVGTYYDSARGVQVNGGYAVLDSADLAHFGEGTVTVTTAGGTSAALALKVVKPGSESASVGQLSDVAVDPVSGALWVVDTTNPGHLQRIDRSTGAIVQTITLDAATFGNQYTGSYAGLQVAPQAFSLNGVNVPAGSLLLFSGYWHTTINTVVAIDPNTGAVITKLPLAQSYTLTAGVYDAVTGHLFVLSHDSNKMIEVDPATGATVSQIALPLNVQSWAGLAIDPNDSNFWIGSYYGGTALVKVDRGGTELQRIDLASQGVYANTISGLAFDADGALRVATTQGGVVKVDLDHDPAVVSATLTEVVATATNGTAAIAGAAAANTGQVIELRGTHFGPGTQVLFNTRNNEGVPGIVAVRPLLINADGTRLQVVVPELATTGDIRVTNIGTSNLGFNSHNDAIYRQVTASFTAGSDTALIRFGDGGLQELNDESWGIDNVVVKQGGTLVFSDNFEGGAKANWSNLATNKDAMANFSEFSGRFNNAGQTLSLGGLTAGQNYTVSFDFYALDSWDGSSGPDLIDVSVDGVSVLHDTVSNYSVLNAQSLNASAGIRLQIVPTLTVLSSGRPGEETLFYLNGSGFMEGASTVTLGGMTQNDNVLNQSPLDVSGNNTSLSVVAPLTLDGPIRITTEGGFAEIPAPSFGVQALVNFSGLSASATDGVPTNAGVASAVTGQSIVLTGQGFTSNTLVQFQGIDDSGRLGTITRTGSVSNNGTTLTIRVPALARSGQVSVLGSNTSFDLQIVPTLRAVGGTVATGNTLVIEGSGLTANDLIVSIDGRAVGDFSVRTLYDNTGSSVDQQLLTLTVPNGIGAGVISVSTAGGSATLRSGVTLTALGDMTPATEVGNTLGEAQVLAVGNNQSQRILSSIGGALAGLDVDLYRIDVNAGDVLSLGVSGIGNSRLRVFDANGVQLTAQNYSTSGTAALRWTAPSGGSYYLGISGSGNSTYDPKVSGSGTASTTGNYTLSIERLAAGSSRLIGISATAASGTAAQAGLASANTGQTITLTGSGLLAGDQVVFSVIDSSGNVSEQTVTPVSVAADGSSLTVVVPANAATGHVRLARDTAGLLLQIVPTLSDVNMGAGGSFIGGSLTLSGSGFAEGTTSVWLGASQVVDTSRSYGINTSNTSLSLTVPNGASSGPIRVSTVGGTSAVFGLTLAGITASAASGTAAGASANPGQVISLSGSGFDSGLDIVFETIDSNGNRTETIVRPNTVNAEGSLVQVTVPLNAVSGVVRVVGDNSGAALALQIIPTLTGVEVQSVASDGSSAVVVLRGTGFIEGNNSEYRFGSGADGVVVLDAGVSAGADVQQIYDAALGQNLNGQVTLTVPLSDGAFGPISVKTAGGVSASFSVSLSSVTATALSGTPANAAIASANPGQAVTLNGAGLSTASDVLLRYTDYSGALQTLKVSPIAAAADGSSATLTVPLEANGIVSLQVFGSSSQPQLQIVPVLASSNFDGNLHLYGAGFVEGGSQYTVGGSSVTDSVINDGVDVGTYYDSARGVQVNGGYAVLDSADLAHFGEGTVTVTTAGGTSAALALKVVKPGSESASVGQLSDVAVDPVSGALWVVDTTNPGHLQRIDRSTGAIVQTITLDAATFGNQYTGSYAGLQVAPQAFSLNGVNVPAGSLLLFSGYWHTTINTVVAIDPNTGAVITKLPLAQSYTLTAGVYDAVTGHLFVLSHDSNKMIEVDPATGATVSQIALPLNVQSWAGLAIDPNDSNFWIGSYYGGTALVKVDRGGTELQRIDLASQGVYANTISGLAFDADGALRVATTQGGVVKVDLDHDPAVVSATLTEVVATATNGTAAIAGAAAANTGQVIELRGTHFGPGTQVLFNTRNNEGVPGIVAVRPLLINADGTRLQVVVPELATTGDIRVTNIGTSNLGFNSHNDAIYRQVTASFTAGSDTALIRFGDGGLQELNDESWGIDNVVVKQGGTLVFSDNFEGGAKANWSNLATNKDAMANFSEFSGRFNNAGQTLSLGGLTAGQNYTVSFDFYALDSWDGSSGPDLIDVSVDGVSVLHDTVSNYSVLNAQSLNASAGIRLQIVPTLTVLSSGRPGEETLFYLNGSGFMEGASTVTLGGMTQNDNVLNQSPLDVSGNNTSLSVVAPLTLDGPIRITTEGGFAEIPAPSFGVQALVNFSGLSASATDGVPTNAGVASAVTGQSIVLTGQGFTSNTLVQFQGIDDSGRLGTITRTGSVSNNGTTLTIRVPALARSGQVSVLGSNTSFDLQIVPTLRAVGGTVATGNTLVIEGSGLTANDLIVSIDGRAVGDFSVRTLYDNTGSSVDQQLLTLTVPNGIGAGVISVSTAGGSATLRSGVTLTALGDMTPATEVGNTLGEAQVLAVGNNQSQRILSSIGGALAGLDVDLYRIDVNAGDVLSLGVSGIGNSRLRVFDANGVQLTAQNYSTSGTAALRWTAPSGGSYYLGISGSGNSTYDPKVSGSGTASTTGNYTLSIERLAAGSSRLIGISATAASGTAAQAGLASANTGQTITLTGSGLLAGDQVVFSVIDSSGNVSEQTVTPVSVAADGSSLTVVVPANAATGHVRLARDTAGLLLQIVPTLSDVNMGAGGSFIGGSLTLSGSGFAEGTTSVWLGASQVVDTSRSYGINTSNTSLSLTVPNGASSGPIRVSTVGGTSAVFGLTLAGITASAASGTAAGASANPGQVISLSGSGFDSGLDIVFETIDSNGNRTETIVRPNTVNAEGSLVQVTVPLNAVSGVVRVVGDNSGAALALQIIPTLTGVEVQSVASDGSSAVVVLRGTGFIEGNNSEYRFGSGADGVVVLDAGVSAGADVQQIYDAALGQNLNGQVTLTVPLSDGAFGPISVKTAGGVSASFSVSLSSVTATALSGTPANAAIASANPGQAVTLNGAGLSTASDVLLRYTDYSGALQTLKVSPIAAAADGSSATLTVPLEANGIVSLQVFGSSSQPQLQIVPVLASSNFDGNLHLYGAGFVEGGSQYTVGGSSVTDSVINDGVDVGTYYDSARGVQVNGGYAVLDSADLAHFGEGTVTVTTAGGTSAALALKVVKPGSESASVGQLSDVAVDPVSGALWVVDTTNPGHLQRIDRSTGAIVQTITLDAATFGNQYTGSYAGLQVAPQAFSLNGVNVPAGSLLLFSGYWHTTINTVVAIDPNTGAVITKLPLAQSYTLTAGVYDAVTGHLFVLSHDSNKMIEVDPATGATVSQIALPLNVQSWAGLAIDPNDGNFWIGSYYGGTALVKVDRGGTELQRIDLASQGVYANTISGLAFDADGALRVATTQGGVIKVSLS
ncbi:Ig-like domain-containing protein [Methylomicrobium lacus]|uniref:Ig-like domain-containing protein n=1 Tax=Methylomicrobium lacus TaxID=136992 RepID=UPI0035A9874D